MATEREIQFRKSLDSRFFPALDFDNIHEYPNRYLWDDQSPKFHGSRDEASRHVKSFIDYASKLNIKHEDLLMKSFHDSLKDIPKSWVTIHSKRKSFSSLSSLIRSFRIYWDSTFDHEGDPFSFEDDHSDKDYLMPLDDQDTSPEPSEESMQEKIESQLHCEESVVIMPSSLQINESISLYENPSLEIPQVILEESPLEEPLDCPSCTQSMKIEIHEPNVTSPGYDDSVDEMFELRNRKVVLPSISSQESTLCTEYSLNPNDHDRDFLVDPICNTSNDGSILSNILDHQSIGEGLELKEVGSHLHILESPKDLALERDTYDESENLSSIDLGETFKDHFHKDSQDQIILEHLADLSNIEEEGVDHSNLDLEILDKEMENVYTDPYASSLNNDFFPSSSHFQNIFSEESYTRQDLSFHPSHPSSTSDSFTSLNSHPYLEDYIHPIDAWIEDSCTWYPSSSISHEYFLDFEVSSLPPFLEHNGRFINLFLEWLHFIFDFT